MEIPVSKSERKRKLLIINHGTITSPLRISFLRSELLAKTILFLDRTFLNRHNILVIASVVKYPLFILIHLCFEIRGAHVANVGVYK
jgi:hypothetical protein